MPHCLSRTVMAAAVALAGCGGESMVDGPGPADLPALVEALRGIGASVTVRGVVSQPFFDVSGRSLTVNGEDVQVFEYANEEAAAAAAAQVAPGGDTIGATSVLWVSSPHFFRKGRLIALYVGESPGVIGPVTAVLGRQFAGR